MTMCFWQGVSFLHKNATTLSLEVARYLYTHTHTHARTHEHPRATSVVVVEKAERKTGRHTERERDLKSAGRRRAELLFFSFFLVSFVRSLISFHRAQNFWVLRGVKRVEFETETQRVYLLRVKVERRRANGTIARRSCRNFALDKWALPSRSLNARGMMQRYKKRRTRKEETRKEKRAVFLREEDDSLRRRSQRMGREMRNKPPRVRFKLKITRNPELCER